VDGQQHDWQSHPVIHLDLARINPNGLDNLRQSLMTSLSKLVRAANLQVRGDAPAAVLSSFIGDLARTRRQKVVVLVDGYEIPIVGNLARPELLARVWEEMVGLYAVLGETREHLRFSLLAGVSRFDRQALFPGLPDLRDITFDPRFSALCGLSVAEFDEHFRPYMESVLAFLEDENLLVRNPSLDELRQDLLDWYGGYSWDGRTRVINPFFLLHFFRAKEFNNFWHTAKAPAKIVTLVRKHDLAFHLFDRDLSMAPEGNAVNIDDMLPIPVLFQNGFLTVAKAARQAGGTRYSLAIPNFASRWLLFVYLMAKRFNLRPGHLWTEIDQLLRALRNRNAQVTSLAFKRLLTSFHHHMEPPFSEHYRQVFLYTMSILGQPLWVDDPEGQGVVNGLFKAPDSVLFVMQMVYRKPEAGLPRDDGQEGQDDAGYHADDEWLRPSGEILAHEERLSGEARACLARLDKFGYARTLLKKGLKVVKAAMVVQSNSVVKVLFEDA
jgi:hypothetical protein